MITDDIVTKNSKIVARKIKITNQNINTMLMGHNAFNPKPQPTYPPQRPLTQEEINQLQQQNIPQQPQRRKHWIFRI